MNHIEALLRLLAEWEREELEMLFQERRGRAVCIDNQPPAMCRGFIAWMILLPPRFGYTSQWTYRSGRSTAA